MSNLGPHKYAWRLVRSPLVWVGALIVVAHLPYLLGFFDPNPILQHSNISYGLGQSSLPGTNSLDPNDGFTSQALAHRAMLDWVSGHIPWWNPYEGMGAPLVGEMQSAAFFPFAILTLLSNGQMWMYLVLGLIAGYSTYFLILRLGLPAWIALVAAVCFGLNGTFSWFSFAPANPICFLPLMLLGVEFARERVQQGRRSHWWIIAVGLALSLVAGFPETTYLDALLVVVWTVVRCFGLPRPELKRFVTVTVGGGVTGALLSGPFLGAIASYLPYASLGPNTDTGTQVMPPRGIVTLFFPYSYGSLWSHIGGRYGHLIANVWGIAGGYTTVALLLLAVFGLLQRELRPLKIALAIWCAVMVAGAYKVPVISTLLRLIPGMTHVVIARYMDPSLTLALLVLAAFGIRDLCKAQLSYRQILLSVGAVTVVSAIVAVDGFSVYHKVADTHLTTGYQYTAYTLSVLWGFTSIVLIALTALILKARAEGRDWGRRVAMLLLIALLPIEAVGMFVIPEFSAPTHGRIDMRLVRYLQRHIGHERFVTIGPILPNYGSYFGIAGINENDLPVPKRFYRLVMHRLDPNANPVTFTGTVQVKYPGISPAEALRRYLSNYENLGVKYLLVTTAGMTHHRRHHHHHDHHNHRRHHHHDHRRRHRHLSRLEIRARRHKEDRIRVYHRRTPHSLRGLGLRRLYIDHLAVVYELPATRSFYSTASGACTIEAISWTEARADCRTPATMIRNELYMPGWHAHVNGSAAPITATKLAQQQIKLPAGESVITFGYRPRYADAGWLMLLIGAIACALSVGLFERPVRALRRHSR